MNSNTFKIKGKDIQPGKVYCLELTMKDCEETLITGIIYNPDCTISSGAAVEIVEIGVNKERVSMGCVFANKIGEYGFTLKVNPHKAYEFNIYSPIN